ncbi:MAG: sodium:solute symporter family protein [Opitutaceae bacterium]|nr:sodium:solute symporter family protein [Opitutaceae bacterium]
MTVLGLHLFDALVIVAYIIAVLLIGKLFAHGVKGESDFFLGGRSLGKWFQFFLSFGNMTDPGQATTTASSVYRQGVGGAWLTLITLFLTPYYWFTNVWFRRVRLTTTAELFDDRFGCRFLATLYAVTTIMMAIVSIAGGNVVALKTLQPLMVKDPAIYSVVESQRVSDFHEFSELRKLRQASVLPEEKSARYEVLKGYYDRGELQPYVTYLHPVTFYLISTVLVATFVMLGGLKASAVVDAMQAVLVILISIILIPFGLFKLGGADALHEKVPAVMLNLFGGGGRSEYTWYSIAALLFVQFVGIVGSQANMTIAGSAKNELAARLGAVTGGFSKRFVTIAWCYCGLIALALFGPGLSDPDQAWGLLTSALLPVGLIGVMIIGILGGKLALLGALSVVLSGLVVKNLYEPMFPGKSTRHYMVVARLTVPVVLGAGVAVGLYLNSVIALLKFAIVLLVIWGVPITLMFIWRRLTETAVRIQVVSTIVLVAVIPWVVPSIPALARSESLTAMTRERVVTVQVHASAEDVAAGRAAREGETVTRQQRMDPVSIYFEEGVVHLDPKDLSSPRTGRGLFFVEVYLVRLLGFDVAGFSPAQLLTTRYLVDALFPIFTLLVISLLTRPTEKSRLDRFYVRLKTPVGATLEEDAAAVEASYANPTRFDHQKLFPRTNWEFTKWNRQDFLGFLGCCALVGGILLFFKGVLLIGS